MPLETEPPGSCTFPCTLTPIHMDMSSTTAEYASWLPDLRTTSATGTAEVGAWPVREEDERYPHDQYPSPPQLQNGEEGDAISARTAADSASPNLPKSMMSTCVSLPNLPSPVTGGVEATHATRGWAGQGGMAVTGGISYYLRCRYAVSVRVHILDEYHTCRPCWMPLPMPPPAYTSLSKCMRVLLSIPKHATAISLNETCHGV